MSLDKNITIFATAKELSEAAALFICSKAAVAIKERGRFSIALSGGHTPEKLFTLLSQAVYKDAIALENVFVFWGDERSVPLDDERNNAHAAKELWLDKVNIPTLNIYRIPSDLKPNKAASLYEDTIQHFFKGDVPSFDLILLGLGDNGHTASLFPYSDALNEQSHIVTSLYVEELAMSRITMTADLINMAYDVLFLVSGEDKAAILNIVINGASDHSRYPAQMINPHNGGLHWYIDKGAAKQLETKQF